MPYIGRELDRGNYLKLDDISSSFDGSTTTFNLTNGGNAFYPGSAFSILVVLAGVVQEPEAAYQINQTQITFASAPLAGDQFFCIVLGQALGVNTPANGSVNGTQLAKPFNYDNYFYLNDTTNRVGVGTATPMTPLHVEGTGRFTNVTVTGDLTVEGTTSTLDTVVTEVDKLEVGANNNTVGVAITQSGSGDAAYFMGGDVGIGTNNPQGKLHISDTNHPLVIDDNSSNVDQGIVFTTAGSSTYKAAIRLTPGGGDKGLRFHTGGYVNSAERLRIHSDGKFSFGTATASAAKYTFNSAGTNEVARFTSTDTGAYLAIKDNSSTSINFIEGGGDVLSLGVNSVERLRITTSGVGIGTDDPQSQFEVYGTSPIVRSKHKTSQAYTQINHNGTDGYLDWSSGGLILRGASNAERLRITSTGAINCGHGSLVNLHGSAVTGINLNGNNNSGQIIANASNNRALIIGRQLNYGQVIEFFQGTNVNQAAITIPAANSFGIQTAGTERLRIASDGVITGRGELRLSEGTSTVSNGDEIGSLMFIYPSNDNKNAKIVALQNAGTSGADLAFFTRTQGDGTNADGGEERLRITSNGKVGIDSTTPHRQLVVGDGGDISCFGTNGGIYFGTSTGGFRNNGAIARAAQAGYHVSGSQVGDLVMAPEADKDLIISSGSTNTMYERLRVTTGGNIGINVTNPDSKFHVNSGAETVPARFESTGAQSRIGFQASGTPSSYHVACGAEANDFIVYTNNAEKLRIDSDGNLGINKTPETDWASSYRAIEIGNSSVSAYQGTSYPSIELNMNCRGTQASYGAGWKYILGMRATQIHLPYSGETIFRRATSGSVDGAITWSESMRIDSAGLMGVGGVTSPATNLDVNGSLQLRAVSNSGGYTSYATRIYSRLDSTHCSVIESYLNNNTAFEMMGTYADGGGSNPRTVISAGGQKVGINTTNPQAQLHVDGTIHQTGIEYPTIRPTLDLNFATTKVLDDRITFTRDTIGTYIDELGIVKYASNNTPRFDHDPVTGESLGLLIENSETNYIPYSNGIGSGWGNNGTYTNTVTDVNAPDGTAGVTEFLERNTGAYHATYYSTVSVNGSSSYTLSAWLKKGSNYDTNANGTGNYQIYCSRGTGSVASVTIDPTFTILTGSNTDSRSITQYPNGWIRVSFTFTSNASASVTPHFLFGGGGSYTGNGTNNVYVWGIQFERNSFPSSYIPTNGAETTRASDFATIKGTNFTDFYNQTEGTLFGEFTIKDTTYSSAAIANINQEPGSSYAYSIMFVEIGTANGYFGRTYKNSGGLGLSNSSSVLNSLHPSTTPQKVTFGYTTATGGTLAAYWNGNYVNSSSDLSKVPTTLTNMRIGRGWGGSDVINAHIRKLSYYNKRLPNAQLQGLTHQ